jgi:glycosyltransferase involved in cell wall biosynthesis
MSDQAPAAAKHFPKILFVHDYRPEARALTDLMRQLLLGYPMAQLHWWHCRETMLYEKPDLRAASLHGLCLPEKLVPSVRWTGVKSFLLESCWAPLAAWNLERTIAAVHPDLIWILLFGWTIPVVERTRFPAGARIHASLCDMPDANGMKQALGAARTGRFLTSCLWLVKQAESCSGGGHGMVEEMNAQTGRTDGLVVHSGFEPHHLASLEKSPATQDEAGITRLAYVGTILYEDDFEVMLAALKKARAQLPQKVLLEFFGGRNYRSRPWFEPDWMTEHGMFTDEGLVEALRRCAWGLVVMDPYGKDPRGSRFSFPNKIGTYLSAGVPVLGLTHPASSLAHIMQANRVGRLTTSTAGSDWENFLVESLRLPSPRAAFYDDILRCARTEFNAAEMRGRLWRLWGVH